MITLAKISCQNVMREVGRPWTLRGFQTCIVSSACACPLFHRYCDKLLVCSCTCRCCVWLRLFPRQSNIKGHWALRVKAVFCDFSFRRCRAFDRGYRGGNYQVFDGFLAFCHECLDSQKVFPSLMSELQKPVCSQLDFSIVSGLDLYFD